VSRWIQGRASPSRCRHDLGLISEIAASPLWENYFVFEVQLSLYSPLSSHRGGRFASSRPRAGCGGRGWCRTRCPSGGDVVWVGCRGVAPIKLREEATGDGGIESRAPALRSRRKPLTPCARAEWLGDPVGPWDYRAALYLHSGGGRIERPALPAAIWLEGGGGGGGGAGGRTSMANSPRPKTRGRSPKLCLCRHCRGAKREESILSLCRPKDARRPQVTIRLTSKYVRCNAPRRRPSDSEVSGEEDYPRVRAVESPPHPSPRCLDDLPRQRLRGKIATHPVKGGVQTARTADSLAMMESPVCSYLTSIGVALTLFKQTSWPILNAFAPRRSYEKNARRRDPPFFRLTQKKYQCRLFNG